MGRIEPISTALEYYKSNGVEEVCLQPKYMGSRINVYIDLQNPDVMNREKVRFITRKGYVARFPEEETVRKILKDRIVYFVEKVKDYGGEDYCIIDGEILPWSLLGEGLIKDTFKSYEFMFNNELRLLDRLNFFKEILITYKYVVNIKNEIENEKGESINKISKKELIERLGHHTYTVMKSTINYMENQHLDVNSRKECIDIFSKQLELYGQKTIFEKENTNIDIKPFMILKIDNLLADVILDGNNAKHFQYLNDDDVLILNLSDENYKDSLKKAEEFFNRLSFDLGYEGIVVKPLFIERRTRVAPYIKVRNEHYLTIIYGALYLKFYEKYCKSKNYTINKKIRASIEEWNGAMKLLEFNPDEISLNNEEFVNAYLEFMHGVKLEEETDPRL